MKNLFKKQLKRQKKEASGMIVGKHPQPLTTITY